jgi:putative membrane-bound dehydrogenase-like protein
MFARYVSLVLLILALGQANAEEAETMDLPVVLDDRLQLTLFAEDPQIVTPVGMVVEPSGRLLVIESHTHSPPRNYKGPKTDRIKWMLDTDDDGRCNQVGVFAEGLQAAMNLALSPAGVLYAICAREVVALYDDDQDGTCDRKKIVLRLITSERYPHNSLLSITFGPDGLMYLGRGNTGSRLYSLRGTDDSEVSGYGDGGSIIRCREDGRHLELFATGFWNPFDIKFDSAGRLLCVDNDPDARGPNRLVHVVAGGDYGFRSLYGGDGNHPFQGWDGDLPGVLPIASPTGEAPAGLLDCRKTSLPADMKDDLLVTVWNEYTIERHQPKALGASFTADVSLLVQGGKEFRPVAIDADARGNVYFTDWMLVDYPNHGRGRIWRLSSKPSFATEPYDRPPPASWVDGRRELQRVMQLDDVNDTEELVKALSSDDKFLQHAAVMALSDRSFACTISGLATHAVPRVRLGALLAMKRNGQERFHPAARQFLHDPDVSIRQAALIWIGERMLVELRDELSAVLQQPGVSRTLLETYFAAFQSLDDGFVRAYRSREKDRAQELTGDLPDRVVLDVVNDLSLHDSVRALAVARLKKPGEHAQLLLTLATKHRDSLQSAAIRQLGNVPSPATRRTLRSLAGKRELSAIRRAEAILSLSRVDEGATPELLDLLTDDESLVRVEAARALRGRSLDEKQGDTVKRAMAAYTGDARFVEQCCFLLKQEAVKRPDSIPQWEAYLAAGGDAVFGERVFHSPAARCNTCHTIDGHGATLGPNLTQLIRSVDRSQIVKSILRPSDAFAPQHQAWRIITMDGLVISGLQIDHKANGAIEIISEEGKKLRFEADEIDDYVPSRESIMPSGLEATMTALEMRDLVAYIATLR